MVRVLFDTAVVVAGARPRRDPTRIRYSADLLTRWEAGRLRGIVSDPLLEEYRDVLARDKSGVAEDQQRRVLKIARDRTVTEAHLLPAPPYPRITKDPDDDHLIALVTVSDPNYLCTKDVGVLDLHLHRDTVVVAPGVLHGVLAHDDLVEGAVALSSRP